MVLQLGRIKKIILLPSLTISNLYPTPTRFIISTVSTLSEWSIFFGIARQEWTTKKRSEAFESGGKFDQEETR